MTDQWDSTRVKALREALGLTQEGLARKIDVTLSAVQSWEAGRYMPSPLAQISLRRLERLAAKDRERLQRPPWAVEEKEETP